MARKIRVVVAKPGLDGHDRGAKIVARALRDAGMEVIYTGLHQTPEQIVETAIQEDADGSALDPVRGPHELVPRILEGLREQGAEDVLVVVGGHDPDDDAAELRERGVAGVFTPGAPTSEIVDFLKESDSLSVGIHHDGFVATVVIDRQEALNASTSGRSRPRMRARDSPPSGEARAEIRRQVAAASPADERALRAPSSPRIVFNVASAGCVQTTRTAPRTPSAAARSGCRRFAAARGRWPARSA